MANTDFEIDNKEDEENLYFGYKFGEDQMTLIYNKAKDIALLLKNQKFTDINKLKPEETERYKEVLDMVICYHHDRAGEYLH